MQTIKRYSPVHFDASPAKTAVRENWTVVLEYENEGEGPWIVDLSHRLRVDLQSADLSSWTPLGTSVPETPGTSTINTGIVVNRMNATQASVYDLGKNPAAMPEGTEYTDITENTLCIALLGSAVFSVCEKLCSLDFADPALEAPFLLQGPFSHVPCQIVTLCRDEKKSGMILTCSRGYRRDMIHAIMHAGEEFGLQPAGEQKVLDWLASL